MSSTLLLYLNNLKGPVEFVATGGIIICAAVAALIAYDSWRVSNTSRFELVLGEARPRIRTCFLIAAGLGLLHILMAALPAPDYNVRIVEKRVEVPVEVVRVVEKPVGIRTVEVLPTYAVFYGQCSKAFGVDIEDPNEDTTLTIDGQNACRAQALEAMSAENDNSEPVNEFDRVFRWCNDQFTLDGAPKNQFGQLRNERLKICQGVAREAVAG